jgi:hypothetical protein
LHFNQVLTLLTLKINLRKAGTDPTQEKNKLLRETKKENFELKQQLAEINQKTAQAKDEISKLSSTKTPPTEKAAKSYVT